MTDVEAVELIKPDDDEEVEDPPTITLIKVFNRKKLIASLSVAVLIILMIVSLVSVLRKTEKKDDYPDLQAIETKLRTIASDSVFVKLESVGKTFEQRNIYSLVIQENSVSSYPLVWIVCGIHPREWTSPLTCVHYINKILQAYNLLDKNLLKKFRYKIIPVANPDGYVYSHTDKRLVRKNRNSSGCDKDEFDGIDLNRNFEVGFNMTQQPPCSDTFPGTQAFSESETRALRDALKADPPKVFVSIHGNAQSVLVPYAYTYENTVESKLLTVLGTEYNFGPASSAMYPVGGTMMDWVAEELDVKRVFTVELKSLCDGDTYELTVCHWQPDITLARQEILPEAMEILDMILDNKI